MNTGTCPDATKSTPVANRADEGNNVPKIDRYAVMGNPIGHSKSPRIHTMFAKQTRQHLVYEAILVGLGRFPDAVGEFRQAGGKGLNVTVPFKQDAWSYAEERTARAERAGAVNTLVLREDGSTLGENTDGVGLVRDLCVNHGVALARRRILVLGAGGAVRGVLEPVLFERPESVVIANRTPEKAELLAQEFADMGTVRGCGLESLGTESFHVIVNGTAAGLTGDVPPLDDGVLEPGGCCYDMVYANEPTAFVRWARAHDAALALDGLGMLVEQAAESFQIWRGVRPDTESVIAALR